MSKLPKLPANKTSEKENVNKKAKDSEISQKTPKPHKKKGALTSSSHNIPRNVNLYRHLITEAATTETDIDWILGLRFSDLNQKLKPLKTAMEPFQVSGKETETQKQKKVFTDLTTQGDISNCEHLIFSRIGPTVSKGLVSFETTLRSYSQKNDDLRKKELSFWKYPKKDRKEFPSFLPSLKQEIELRKSKIMGDSLDSKNFVSAFEGRLHYPKYDIRFSERNINKYLHLTEKDVERGTIEWELSLHK